MNKRMPLSINFHILTKYVSMPMQTHTHAQPNP